MSALTHVSLRLWTKAGTKAPPNNTHSRMADVEALFSHLCGYLDDQLPFCRLVRCSAVSHQWMDAVRKALPTVRGINFRGYEEWVTGADVLCALARVAGANVRAVDMSHCWGITGLDMELILDRIGATCPGVSEITVIECRPEAVLRAVAVRASIVSGVSSPLELFELFEAQHPQLCGAKLNPWRDFLETMQVGPLPHLWLDPEFVPAEDALAEASAHGIALDVALLLGVLYSVGQEGRTRTFHSNKQDCHGQRAIHFAAERGDRALLSVLLSAGAEVNVQDHRRNTPLLLACKARHLELASMLINAGADPAAVSELGNTPLLAACGAGHFELAKMLIEAGASAEPSRTDGAGLLSLAIASQNEQVIDLAFMHGPRRLDRQGQIDSAFTCVEQLARAFFDPASIGSWLRSGASPSELIGE